MSRLSHWVELGVNLFGVSLSNLTEGLVIVDADVVRDLGIWTESVHAVQDGEAVYHPAHSVDQGELVILLHLGLLAESEEACFAYLFEGEVF